MLLISCGLLGYVVIRLLYNGQYLLAIILAVGNFILIQEIKQHWMNKFHSGLDGIRKEVSRGVNIDEQQ